MKATFNKILACFSPKGYLIIGSLENIPEDVICLEKVSACASLLKHK